MGSHKRRQGVTVDLEIPGTREKRRREHEERMAAHKHVVTVQKTSRSIIDWLYGRTA
jgi:hypothetical protein